MMDIRLKRVRDSFIEATGKVFPGAVLLIAQGSRILLHEATGITALPDTIGAIF